MYLGRVSFNTGSTIGGRDVVRRLLVGVTFNPVLFIKKDFLGFKWG